MNDIWFCIWRWCDAYTKNKCTLVDRQLRGFKQAYDLYCEHQQLFLPQVPIAYEDLFDTFLNHEEYPILLTDGTHQVFRVPDEKQDPRGWALYLSPRCRRAVLLVYVKSTLDWHSPFTAELITSAQNIAVSALYHCVVQARIEEHIYTHRTFQCAVAPFQEPDTPDGYAIAAAFQTITGTFQIPPANCYCPICIEHITFVSQTEFFLLLCYYAELVDVPTPEFYIVHVLCVNGTWTIQSIDPYTYTSTEDAQRMNVPSFQFMCRIEDNDNKVAGIYVWGTLNPDQYSLPTHLICYKLDTITHTLRHTPHCIEYTYAPRTNAAGIITPVLIDTNFVLLTQCVTTYDEGYCLPIGNTLVCTGLQRNELRVDFVRYLTITGAIPHNHNAWRRICDQSIMLAYYQINENYVDVYNLTEGSALVARLFAFAQPIPLPSPYPSPNDDVDDDDGDDIVDDNDLARVLGVAL